MDADSALTGWQPLGQGTLGERIRSEILRVLKTRELGPGDRLPFERELAASLRVSRPSVREAVRSLQAEGRLVVKHGAGRLRRRTGDAEVDSASRWRSWTTVSASSSPCVRCSRCRPRVRPRSVTMRRRSRPSARRSPTSTRGCTRSRGTSSCCRDSTRCSTCGSSRPRATGSSSRAKGSLNELLVKGMQTTLAIEGRADESREEHLRILSRGPGEQRRRGGPRGADTRAQCATGREPPDRRGQRSPRTS